MRVQGCWKLFSGAPPEKKKKKKNEHGWFMRNIVRSHFAKKTPK